MPGGQETSPVDAENSAGSPNAAALQGQIKFWKVSWKCQEMWCMYARDKKIVFPLNWMCLIGCRQY